MRCTLLPAILVTQCMACGGDPTPPRPASPAPLPRPVASVPDAPVADEPPVADAALAVDAPTPRTTYWHECKAKLAELGLEAGDACDPPAPAAPRPDEVQDLPKKCVAESPRDKPCKSYVGTYKIVLEVDPAEPATCFGKSPVETTVSLEEGKTYGTRQDLSRELGALLRAFKLRDETPTLGSAVRDGVCCIDIDVMEGTGSTFRRLVVSLASGETVVNAKASMGCDDSGGRASLKVQVTRVPSR